MPFHTTASLVPDACIIPRRSTIHTGPKAAPIPGLAPSQHGTNYGDVPVPDTPGLTQTP
ncbi:hypothetical protein CHS0354_026038, partial [Potamilus streckersoni]